MIAKLLTEHHLEFLSLKEAGQARLSQTLIKIPHCWESHVAAQIASTLTRNDPEGDIHNVYTGSKAAHEQTNG